MKADHLKHYWVIIPQATYENLSLLFAKKKEIPCNDTGAKVDHTLSRYGIRHMLCFINHAWLTHRQEKPKKVAGKTGGGL